MDISLSVIIYQIILGFVQYLGWKYGGKFGGLIGLLVVIFWTLSNTYNSLRFFQFMIQGLIGVVLYQEMQKKEFKVKQSKPVVICIFDKNSMKEYIGLQTLLRNAGISTEIYPGESKLKKQMEYANKIKAPAVILYGEDEIKLNKPTLRDLSTGNEKSIEINELVNEIKKII